MDAKEKHAKKKIALRYWLLGAGYFRAVEAMRFAEEYHCHLRKDGVTPEFAHQVNIASYVRTMLPHLEHREDSIIIALLHDVREDYNVPDEVIRGNWGGFVADGVDVMTKEFMGVRRNDQELFRQMAMHPAASICKGADRIDNQETMADVFTTAKVREYIGETKELFFPMLKAARRQFPRQESAYENTQMMLHNQVRLAEKFLASQP